jgi:DNA-binding MarR family transcriptional regulator
MSKTNEMVEKLLKALAAVEAEENSKPAKVRKPSMGKSAEAKQEKVKKIIDFLKENGGATIPDIQEHIGYSKSNTTLTLAKLVEKGTLEYTRTSPRVYSIKGLGDSSRDKWSGKVIDYVVAHMGERYSINAIKEALGMPDGVVYAVVHRLEKRGLIPKDFNLGNTEVPAPVEAPSTEEPAPQTTDKEAPTPNGGDLLSQIEFLIWTYVRENRDTDILKFLTWLEQR